ncbi:MAG TPA: DUF4199 domain-containing protein [Thermoanaerobaculia bacterium]|nr:DUF4199 domain-containing protein [Thermoanaerobaculia bacterium]
MFGLASGAVLAAVTAILLPLCMNGVIDFAFQEIVGYSAMVLSFLLVFFGVRSYRDGVAGGSITFGRAVGVGLLITLISCAVYVVSWEIVYYGFFPDFLDRYAAYQIERLRADGASAAALAAKQAEMEYFAELYANPLVNVAITFMEVFPVGLVVTLVSAGILRRRTALPPASAEPA